MKPAPSHPAPEQHREKAAVFLTLLLPLAAHLALTLRGWRSDCLWLDEAYGVVLSRIPLLDLPAYLRVDSGPPLLYGYFHILRLFLGESDAAYRLHALAFGVLGLIAVWHVGRTWLGARAAGYAAWFWAASPLIVHYEREARVYTILAFCCLIHIWALQRISTSRGTRRHAIGIAVCFCAALYAHNFGWFLLPAAWLALAVTRAERNTWRMVLFAQGAALLVYSPWLPILYAQMGETERTIGWIRYFTDWKIPFYTFLAFINGGWFLPYAGGPAAPYRWLLWCAVLLHAGVILFSVIPRREKPDRGLHIVLAVFGVLIAGPILASLLVRPMALPGRTDVIAYPCFVLLVAAGLSRIPGPRMTAPVAAALLALAGVLTIWHDTGQPKQRMDAFLAYDIEAYSKPGDVIILTGLSRPTVETYLFMNQEPDRVLLSWPPDMAVRLAHLNQDAYERQPGWPDRHLKELDEQINQAAPHAERILVVDTDSLRINSPLRARLHENYRRNRVVKQPWRLRRILTPMTVDIYIPRSGDAEG